MLYTLVAMNGVYDILCACSILWLGSLPVFRQLAKIHLSMFNATDIDSPSATRFLAYWIFTYGILRLTAAIAVQTPIASALFATSYFVEAFFIQYELHAAHSMVYWKGMLVSAVSAILGVLIVCNY